MTTVFISDKNCFFCGATSKYPVGNFSIGKTGLRDLDGRPAQILRSSVYLWIQRCPSCGYCAPEIAEGNIADRAVLESDEYRVQLDDKAFPETANAFLCHSMVMRSSGHVADAAWAAVFAAWICDDNDYPESAIFCRRTAIELFSSAQEQSVSFAESREHESIYIIDLYRRCADFTTALRLCNEAIEKSPPDQILDLLYFEKDLIEKSDSMIHSISEADEIS